jgi:hypothetical protein
MREGVCSVELHHMDLGAYLLRKYFMPLQRADGTSSSGILQFGVWRAQPPQKVLYPKYIIYLITRFLMKLSNSR